MSSKQPILTEDEKEAVDALFKGLQSKGVVCNDNSIALRVWYRSASEAFRMAGIYEAESDFQKAYILYWKFTNLILEQLPKHNAYHQKIYFKDKTEFNRKCGIALDKLAELKLKIIIDFVRPIRYEKLRKISQQNNPSNTSSPPSQTFPQPEISPASLPSGPPKYSILGQPLNTASPSPPPSSPYLSSLSGPTATSASTPPIVDRSSKPFLDSGNVYSADAGFIGAGSSGSKRRLKLPADLISVFLKHAEKQTRRDLECCAILAGTLRQHVFQVTTLVFPQQNATSNSCTTTERGEEDLFEYQEKKNLISLGWIHTHPSQSCFMSSLDLHTHCNFQLMMSEAIAIVCAVSQNQCGVFTLTEPQGLQLIASCPLRGFHTHPEIGVPIYTEASHVEFLSTGNTQVADLRKPL